MQERLLLEPEPEPEQVVPEVEVRLPQNAQAMVRRTRENAEPRRAIGSGHVPSELFHDPQAELVRKSLDG